MNPLQAGYEVHQHTVRYMNERHVDYATAKVGVLREQLFMLQNEIGTKGLSTAERQHRERQVARSVVDAEIRKRMYDRREDYTTAMEILFATNAALKELYARS